MPIPPDTKDWTWVLERTCPECGFDVRGFPREHVGALIRSSSRQWLEVLEHPDVRRRPSDEVWSALEYACHIRDLFRVFDHRLELMLEEENPVYPYWDQDETAAAGNYPEQVPEVVATELSAVATDLAARFDRVGPDEWRRTGERSDGYSFTIESFARYLMHDPMHHLRDVELGFNKLAGENG